MKKNVKKLFSLIAVLSLSIKSFSGENKTRKNESERQQVTISNEKKMIFGEGINKKFTTDGKLHENKFLNKVFMYTDTDNRFKIEKKGKEYILIEYNYNEEDKTTKEEKSKLKLYKKIYLIDEKGLVYAYDTKLKKLVFLNKENNFRIISEAEEE